MVNFTLQTNNGNIIYGVSGMRSTVACMAMVKMATGNKFSIDDAFESDEEDPIRVYGSTTESAPLRSKRRSDDSKDGREYTREVRGGRYPGSCFVFGRVQSCVAWTMGNDGCG